MKQLYTWGAVAAIVLASTIGDVLLSRAMKQVGDVGELWRSYGLLAVVGRTLHNVNFVLGILAMTVAFYSLLIGLSWGDVSLVAPASASLTFVATAVAAKLRAERCGGRCRTIQVADDLLDLPAVQAEPADGRQKTRLVAPEPHRTVADDRRHVVPERRA